MRTFMLVILALVLPCSALAESRTIRASARVLMGDNLSKQQASRMCAAMAKRKALEEAGVWLESSTTVKDFQLAEDEVSLFTAAFVPVKTTAERAVPVAGSMAVECTVEAQVDPGEVKAQITEARSNTALMKVVAEQQQQIDALFMNVKTLFEEVRGSSKFMVLQVVPHKGQ